MSKDKSYHSWALILLILVAVFWGGGYTATQIAIDNGWSIFSILLFKNIIATVLASIIAFKTKFWKNKKLLKSGLIAGALFFAGYAFQLTGQIYTTISNTAFITTSGLVFVPIINWIIFKKRQPWTVVIAFLLEIGAAMVLSFRGSIGFHIGDLLVMIGAIIYSLHIIYIDRKCLEFPPIAFAAVQFFAMAVLSGVGVLVTSSPFVGESSGFLGILYLALLSGLFCLVSQIWCQKHLSPNEVSIIISQEGLFASIIAVVLYGEELTISLIIGAVIMTIAIFVLQIRPKKRN